MWFVLPSRNRLRFSLALEITSNKSWEFIWFPDDIIGDRVDWCNVGLPDSLRDNNQPGEQMPYRPWAPRRWRHMLMYELNILEHSVQANRKTGAGHPSFKDASMSISSLSSAGLIAKKSSPASLVSPDWRPVSDSGLEGGPGSSGGDWFPPRHWFFLTCLRRVLRSENAVLQRGQRLVPPCCLSPLTRSTVTACDGPPCDSKCLSKSFLVLSRRLVFVID